ncbi:MAG: response regulator [Hyphomicrobiaceae bacterium]
MFKLVRHFTIMSAIAVVAITITLAFLFNSHQMRLLRVQTEERNVAVARLIAQAVWDKYANYISQAAHGTAEQIRANPMTTTIDAELRQATRDLSVAKVKIYTAQGLTVYSSERAQIGESKDQDPAFRRAVDEISVRNRQSFRKQFVGFDALLFDRHMAETYVPIVVAGKVTGVLEVYGDITANVHQIRSEMRWVATLCVLVLGLLYGLLLMIVRRAERIMKQQFKRLEMFNTDLETAVAERTRRLVNQQSVLSWITRSGVFRHGSRDEVCKALTTSIAGSIGVERASIWLYNEDRSAITCLDRYEAVLGTHVSGGVLPVSTYPGYFSALEREEVLAVANALTDPRTSMFADDYLKPNGIGAMLDAPIVQNGCVIGVVCCEALGEPHAWSAEQQLFASAIANLVALTLERLERAAAEASLKDAHANVQSATRAKSLFLANMSHEIRTPMNGVFGMTDLLLRTELTERQQRLAHTIQRSAKSLLTIINDVLDISRIEAGKLSLDANEFDVRYAIEETVDLLAEEADRKGIGLGLYIAPTVPVAAIGDIGRIRQVATNLISNAIKFTKSGEVAIRLETASVPAAAGDGTVRVVLTVRDTGVGIPKDVQERLFQPFHQADTSITRRFGGTGLGLAISRHLVEMMGGTINLVSAEGAGTTITVELPLRESEHRERSQPGRSPADSLRGKRILVLDDRATNREIILAYLKDAGAQATGLDNPEDAIAVLRAAAREGEPFAAALIDMVMPSTTGLEIGRRIKADPAIADTKLVMVTSLSWKGDAGNVRQEGFEALLVKPVRGVDLIATVARAIGSQAGPSTASKAAKSAPTRKQPTLHARVLVAEDNAVNLEVAKEYLSNLRCTVVVAENGIEAIRLFTAQPFDLVLMDCQMPEMDGLSATRRIRVIEESKRLPHTPIIAVTANAFEEDRQACLKAGMDDYIRKPFVEDVLEATMARWLKKKPAEASTRLSAASPVADTTPGSASASEASVLDETLIGRLKSAHRSLLSRLIETYLNYAPKAVAQLRTHVDGSNANGVKTAAHSLKSSSANVGAMGLSGLCRELETLTRIEGAEVTADCAELVRRIEAEFAKVEAALLAVKAQLVQEPAKAAAS